MVPRPPLLRVSPSLLVVVALAAAACTDFATPAELTKPTILAVTAEPPVVAPGAQTDLAVALADGTGVLTGLPTRWSLVSTYPGVPAMGTLTGSTYTAPDPIPTLPANALPIDSVRLEVDTAIGTLVAIKVVPVTTLTTSNPAITGFTVGAGDALAGPVTVAHGASLDVTIATDPPLADGARFAWYSSAGAIDRYQSNPTTMVASDTPTSGWLFAVVRDGKGGVAWRGVEVLVQ